MPDLPVITDIVTARIEVKRFCQTAYADGPRVRPDHVIEDSQWPVDIQSAMPGG